MADKLSLYKAACLAMGERGPATLTENVVMRRRLDEAWDSDFIDQCLARGFWNFATRTVLLDYDPSVDTDFGYQYAFEKPSDWVKTVIVSSDEYFTTGLTRYSDEAGYLFADLTQLYLKFVSNDVQYGLDFAKWPANFGKYAASELALTVVNATTGSTVDVDKLEARTKRLLIRARSTDAMDEPPQFAPRGSWASARVGFNRNRER